MNQERFVARSGVHLALYFERLTQCPGLLSFADSANSLPFPHHPERSSRPDGSFFDLFTGTDEEHVVWAYAAEDFAAFGYWRFECGLSPGAPDTL